MGDRQASATSKKGDGFSESLEQSSGISKLGAFGVDDGLGGGFAQLIISQSWPSRKKPPSLEKSLEQASEKK